MYLKRMELFGFKSFADKTEMEFGPGIAAIIGPNGCGKSNLVDAVRWALGEQSVKVLRGTRMEEIIFSGSETRKPLNFAEVSLTFAGAGKHLNLDYDEVTVTRRLYRSGESEYFLNKSPCRLKDITELFLDTGVGKDIYSIIGQGRVEEIISSKPEDRREIFEEAAGILKYKLRKREAWRRLEETRENLVRVQDLVFELETQLEPLREQAEITRQYRALKEQADSAEKKLLTFKLNKAREELTAVDQQLSSVTDQLAKAAAEESLHEEQLHRVRETEQKLQEQRAQLDQQLGRIAREIEQQEGEQRLLQERENRFKEQKERTEARLEQLNASTVRLQEQAQSLDKELILKRQAAAREEETVARLRQQLAELEKSPLLAEVEERQQRLFQARAQLEAAEAADQELVAQLERLDQKQAELQQEDGRLQSMEQEQQRLKKDYLSRREEHQKKLTEAGEAYFREERRQEALQQRLTALLARDQQFREELRGLQSRLQLLQEQETGMSGYYRGVREVMQAGAKLPGIIGPVADLLSVDELYLRAVESALGSGMQYIVTATEEAAKQAIRYLKEGNRGWATFLPLDTIRPPSSGLDRYPGWREQEGVLGTAADLVRTDPAYQKVTDYLLGHIVVCRDLDCATRTARLIKYSCRVVTLEGDVINPGGAIRGGSMPARNAGQPLGRRREIEALKEKEAALHKKRSGGEEEIADLRRQIEASEEQSRSLKARRDGLAEELARLDRDGQNLEKEEVFLQERRLRAQEMLRQLDAEKKEINQRLAGLAERRGTCRAEMQLLQSELEGKRELYQRSLAEKKDLDSALTAALVALNSCREQERVLEDSCRRTGEELEKLKREQEEAAQEIKKFASELEAIGESRRRSAAALEKLQQDSALLMARLDEQKKEAGLTRSRLAELEEQEKRWRSRLSRLEKRERHLALEQARLQAEVNYQQQRYEEKFPGSEPAVLEPDFDPETATTLVQSLQEDLDALGEVNLGAIEELERLQNRIDFLNKQQDDLKKGELSLRRVLAEIDQQMERYFTRTFEAIAQNMQQVFSELFNGGTVILKLTDPGNVLESGIEIIAQPPGKKLQNITLMSTGEKVLTAVALLFAILRYKPAPFYLLDEVESALDDVNLARFTSYLKRASAEAQFILITHRKRSMEEAGVLYGVTMPESGVSRLVSLKLEEKAG